MTVGILYPPLGNNQQDVQTYIGRMTGASASAPTKVLGRGITFARTGTGTYTATLADVPGGTLCGADVTLIGAAADLQLSITACTTTVVTFTAVKTSDGTTAVDLTSGYGVFLKLYITAAA